MSYVDTEEKDFDSQLGYPGEGQAAFAPLLPPGPPLFAPPPPAAPRVPRSSHTDGECHQRPKMDEMTEYGGTYLRMHCDEVIYCHLYALPLDCLRTHECPMCTMPVHRKGPCSAACPLCERLLCRQCMFEHVLDCELLDEWDVYCLKCATKFRHGDVACRDCEEHRYNRRSRLHRMEGRQIHRYSGPLVGQISQGTSTRDLDDMDHEASRPEISPGLRREVRVPLWFMVAVLALLFANLFRPVGGFDVTLGFEGEGPRARKTARPRVFVLCV